MIEEKKPCLIACGLFREELDRILRDTGLAADVAYLDPGLHNDPKSLEKALTKAIDDNKEAHQNDMIIVYGDVCLGFQNEMAMFTEKQGVIKVDALNCIDCLLGGKGKLLEIDPKHEYFFLNPAWIELEFGSRDKTKPTQEAQEEFSCLSGLYLLDTLGNLNDYTEVIEQISAYTALPVIERKNIGLDGIRETVFEAIQRL